MKIGIKYCGGCNPGYDRKRLVEQLEEVLSKTGIATYIYREDETFDYCIVVKGCSRNCISVDEIKGCKEVLVADSARAFEEIQCLLIKDC